jgi:protein-L-isoaspartate O-methyltransferase
MDSGGSTAGTGGRTSSDTAGSAPRTGEASPTPGNGAIKPAAHRGDDGTKEPGTGNAKDAAAAPPTRTQELRLFFSSFLMLFVELALIRWVTSNNVYVTKATNFVLLASFLGIGIGFMNARTKREYMRWTPVALLVLVGFVLGFPVILGSTSGPHPYRGLQNTLALPQWLSLSIVFVLVVAVMAGLGQGVARIFTKFRPLSAYRLDIAGSIAGILLFSLLSFLNQPPATWGFIACIGLVVMLAPKVKWYQVAAALIIVTLLSIESFVPDQTWSPYNKLSINATHGANAALYVSANNIPYQAARSLALLKKQKPFYFYPYLHIPKTQLKNVLIIGAGTGNDTTVALSEGAQHIDAVEIDPELLQIGRDQNPSQPYENPRVTTHNADGREFLEDTNKKYNLILFALPDSLEAVSGQSAVRLESFLLTKQSVQAVKAHLVPGGTFSMYNYYAPFLLNRYASTIESAFSRVPCQNIGPPLGGRRLAVLTAHLNGPVPGCTTYWHGAHVAPSTDDHPFPYLPTSTIPGAYLLMLGAILLGSLILVLLGGGVLTRRGFGGLGEFRGMHRYLDLAFMGAAFMLLETKNVVQFALLFGTTWFVNSLVFAGVLISVYLAVETARHIKLPPAWVLYVLLIASLVLTWLVPPDAPLGLPLVPRFLAAASLAFAPIYLANLVFSQRFANVEAMSSAFAANLLGAIVGGVLEYLALATGYRFLLVVVGILYGLAFLTRPWRQKAGTPATADSATPAGTPTPVST